MDKKITLVNKDKRKSLLQAVSCFEGGTGVRIKSIRIIDNKTAILTYVETVESSFNARSGVKYVDKTKR